jgi:stage II sporulation protein R
MRKAMTLAMAAMLLLTAIFILPIHGEAGIYDNVIRLHVLANSDSEEDQALKLKVRDAILAKTEGVFDGATSRAQAEERLLNALPQIEAIAVEALAAEGVSTPVAVSLDYEEYPRRSYESLALPAGEYLSLRVQIGAAEGQNWWCVMFPPLCMSAASEDREATCLAAGLTNEQYRLITDSEGMKYRVRFKLLEVAEQLFG